MGSRTGATQSAVATKPGPEATGRRLVGYGISLLALLGFTVAASDILNPDFPAVMRLGVALCLAAQTMVIFECLRPSRLLWPITVLAVLGIAAIGTSLVLHPAPVPGMEWRTNIWLGPVLQFLILLHPRRRGWPLLAVVALPVWGAVIMVHHLDWRIQVLDLVFTLTPVATLGIGGACITNLLMELRLSQLRRIHDEQAGQRAQMREQERRVRIRLAHDSLLHTLQQISRDWDQPTREEAAGLAASAVSDLLASSQSFGDGGWTALHSLLEPALQDEGCDIEWHGRAVLAPSTVSDALVGATREAVRNVVKHAGVSAFTYLGFYA